MHSVRHTRRGFFRGDAAPKFFPLVELSGPPETPRLQEPARPAETVFRSESVAPPASDGLHALSAPAGAAAERTQRFPPPPRLDDDDSFPGFRPHPSHLLHNLDGTLLQPGGHAFLSWLADQITYQAQQGAEPVLSAAADDLDAHLDEHFAEQIDFAHEDGLDVDLSYELEASYCHEEDGDLTHLCDSLTRGKQHPVIEPTADGGRLEIYPCGSKIVKDALGRVVEVHSQYGDALYFRYGIFGRLESFQRIDAGGRTHSEGTNDKHGVLVRDHEGRVKAVGESMTVDPHGCFYLHTVDGQYFSVDLVSGLHSERRRVADETGGERFVTSLFTHDGFRMATMYGPTVSGEAATAFGGMAAPSRLRFYGRDGTVIEFAGDDDLVELRPLSVSSPARRPVHKGWLKRRQASTAWESVHEYLMRVG